jgi:tryptophanyl-tRNA synthetase
MSQASVLRVLTGIKPTGSPHLGNYVGAIRPAIQASLNAGTASYFFLADYHALIGNDDPHKVQRATLEIAASWLALGLDPDRVVFYRQSDIPEIPELCWLLTCVTAKGLLNRAHAYKAAVDINTQAGLDADHAINAGLYAYPILMAADILMFNAARVPVGKDQVQHIEIARDLATRFNHSFAPPQQPIFVLPEAQVDEETAVLPGLDGRKMSKSYGNTIPLWLSSSALKNAIAGIVTNAKKPGEPKLLDDSALFAIYKGFASPAEIDAMQQHYADGMGWGEIKAIVNAAIERELAPARAKYEALVSEPVKLEAILQAGAAKARVQAAPFLQTIRAACGLRSLHSLSAKTDKARGKKAARVTTFKDSEGFRFKLVASDGKTLLESIAFENAKDCGVEIAQLKSAAPAQFRSTEFGCEFESSGRVLANGTEPLAHVIAAIAELQAESA